MEHLRRSAYMTAFVRSGEKCVANLWKILKLGFIAYVYHIKPSTSQYKNLM